MTLLLIIVAFLLLAIGLVWFLVAKSQGDKVGMGSLWAAVGFGLAGIIAAIIIESLIPVVGTTANSNTPIATLFMAALLVGVIEETCKFVPFAVYVYRKPYFNQHVDGIIYFAIVGLAFAVPENIGYTLEFGAAVGLTRIIMTPFFHATTTSMIGYFLAKSKVDKQSLLYPLFAACLAALIHALYDFGIFTREPLLIIMSALITIGMLATFFILFMKARELDRAAGLVVVGNNSFCRSCGYPNPKHNLYCTRCGNHA